jgi:hypothetical protein
MITNKQILNIAVDASNFVVYELQKLAPENVNTEDFLVVITKLLIQFNAVLLTKVTINAIADKSQHVEFMCDIWKFVSKKTLERAALALEYEKSCNDCEGNITVH